jgi:hypothetical protein
MTKDKEKYMCTQSSNYSPSSIPSLLDGKSIVSFILYPYRSLIGCSTIAGWFDALAKYCFSSLAVLPSPLYQRDDLCKS